MFRSLAARIVRPAVQEEQPAMIVGKSWDDWDAPIEFSTPMTWTPGGPCDPNAAWGE